MATPPLPEKSGMLQTLDIGYNRSDSGPATPPTSGNNPTKGVQRAAAVGSTAGKMSYNPTKAAEHGHENALNPPHGATYGKPKLHRGCSLRSKLMKMLCGTSYRRPASIGTLHVRNRRYRR